MFIHSILLQDRGCSASSIYLTQVSYLGFFYTCAPHKNKPGMLGRRMALPDLFLTYILRGLRKQ